MSGTPRPLTPRAKLALPAAMASLVTAAGVSAYWCRDPLGAALLVLAMAVAAAITCGLIVSDDF